ncbi:MULTISPECIES: winged helix-turn-helix transcriptional regulator [Streptomyces]|uniref:Winged helix-turn-helix transcriptional regulator n=1 Tax=Streptomyces evansiae TaxID=3075535 RepID=A0ABU2QTL3_9ACTN|nr:MULTISPECIES: winged helix-turn-helix transcriptional regulator [unclassified Streptomyces]MDT0407771.1 winged helix-turn-helix transcriptional regulator [Streptomyces sp. DSM 41979]MYQ60908.1 transcriptional regulator [Streptomyces sp. SID4926]SCE23790.1 transcriptional regulator, HxlR family [Streptomyces sp. DfronAA-171]
MSTPTTKQATDAGQAISKIAPRWTTWVVQTLEQHGPLRPGALAKHLPFVSSGILAKRLTRMAADGLIESAAPRKAVALTPLGTSLHDVHTTLGNWSRQHDLLAPPAPEAERVEDALHHLAYKHLTPFLNHLTSNPGATITQLAHANDLTYVSAQYGVDRLCASGILVEENGGPRVRGNLFLTRAGVNAVGLLDQIASWNQPKPHARMAAAPQRPLSRKAPAPAAPRRGDAVRIPPPAAPEFSHIEHVTPWSLPSPPAGASIRR